MHYSYSWQDAAEQNLLITVDGKLLFGNFQDLQSFIFSLKEKPPAKITFDLSKVPLIDSSGLGLLIVANEITGENKNITLKNPMDQVRQLFDVCKIDKLMDITP
ncbi:STAS domain-containing protein [Terasakiella pusilla]|jgi:anti-anti-sigma factor|uniref:STAS domain-containing protein n=1 Tax=Terasakiella pusilla TaxID=64973 RepID=UPI003AA88081